MRHKELLVVCVMSLLFLGSRDASAFWKYIGELSGPGYFVGMDFLFPYSIRYPELSAEQFELNQIQFRRLGIDVVSVASTRQELVKDKEYCRFFAKTLDFDVSKLCEGTRDEDFDENTKFSPTSGTAAILRRLGFKDQANAGSATFEELKEAIVEHQNRIIKHKISQFGAGRAGLFGSLQPLPKLDCELSMTCSELGRNWFFTLALGFAFAVENNLMFPDDHDGDTDVIWLSAYPALEKRIHIGDGENYSVFVNGGVALNRWIGPGFDDFSRVSFKGRIGARFLGRFYGGFEIERFTESIPHANFGSTSPGEPDPTSWGWFVGLELVRPLDN